LIVFFGKQVKKVDKCKKLLWRITGKYNDTGMYYVYIFIAGLAEITAAYRTVFLQVDGFTWNVDKFIIVFYCYIYAFSSLHMFNDLLSQFFSFLMSFIFSYPV
jgi:hypothetical protein